MFCALAASFESGTRMLQGRCGEAAGWHLRGSGRGNPFFPAMAGWEMPWVGISAVADEAAHCYMRKLFERCHGLAILNFSGWVASPR